MRAMDSNRLDRADLIRTQFLEGLGMTQQEIGRHLGLSQQTVSRYLGFIHATTEGLTAKVMA